MNFQRGRVFLLVIGFSLGSNSKKSIGREFKTAGIVHDIIDYAPTSELELYYIGHDLRPGESLTPRQTKDAPSGIEWTAESDKKYTLIMLDPDAISRQNPMFRSFLHWLVVNVPGNNFAEGEVKASYKGPGPPKGTGFHRYVFLVWEQTKNIDIPKVNARPKFSMKNFIKQHHLVQIPVAGNYFLATA